MILVTCIFSIILLPTQLSTTNLFFSTSNAHAKFNDNPYQKFINYLYNECLGDINDYCYDASLLHGSPFNGNDYIYHYKNVPNMYLMKLRIYKFFGSNVDFISEKSPQ